MNNEIISVFKTIDSIARYMKEGNSLLKDELNPVIISVEEINTLLFGTKKLRFQTKWSRHMAL